jgi:hypothetical protein
MKSLIPYVKSAVLANNVGGMAENSGAILSSL